MFPKEIQELFMFENGFFPKTYAQDRLITLKDLT